MADLSIILPETGLTLIGKVYNSSGTQQGSDVSMTESATNVYTGTYNESGLASGTYDEFPILFSASSAIKGEGVLKVNDGVEVNDRFLPNLDVAVSTRSDFDEAVNDVNTNTASRDASKADVSSLATQASVDTIDANVDTILVDTSTTIPNQISGLNNISTADVKAQADQALIDYDPPTKAELDSAESSIIASIPSVANIADGVWDEPYNQHTTAGTFGKLMDNLRKSNRAIEGEVTGTPTTTSFTSNMTGYVTGAFDSEVLVFVSGTINGEARPILDYNATNGTFNFEEAWTQAPSSSDEFVILPYHVHAISEIQEGLATEAKQDIIDTNVDAIKVKTDQLNFTGSDVQSIASNMRGTDGANTIAPDNTTISNIYVDTQRADSLIENVAGDRFTQKALEQSPTAEVSEVEFHSYLDSYTNKNNWKADVSGLATQLSVDNLNDLSTADIDARLVAYGGPTLTEMTSAFTEIKGAGWTTTDTLEAIRNAIDSGGSGVTPADVWTYATRTLTGAVTTDTASREASKADVSGIPTNPLLTNDVRLDNLDATISSRSTLTASGVWSHTTRTLSSFGTLVSDIWSNLTRTLTAGTKDAEIDAIKAKTDQLNFTGPDVQSVASNMRGTDGANTIAPDNAGVSAIQAKTDNLPADPASESNVDTKPTLVEIEASTKLAKKSDVQALY